MGLAEDANKGVTATVLVILTIACLLQIRQYVHNFRYKEAQLLTIPILTLSFVIGWGNWVILYDYSSYRMVSFLLDLYKSIIFFCFLKYIERIIGWENEEDSNYYNPRKLPSFITSLGRLGGCFKCSKCGIMKSEKRALKYIKIVRLSLLQFPILLVLIFIFALVIYLTDADVPIGYSTVQYIKSASSGIAMFNLVNLIFTVKKHPEVYGLDLFSKFSWVQNSVLVTELQPTLLSFFAETGVIYSTDTYSADEITAYTNAMFVFFQMIILGFKQFHTFPVSDYFSNPRERLKDYQKQKLDEEQTEYKEIKD